MLSILKVHDIPFNISNRDTVLAENVDSENLEKVLTDLGYAPKDTKTHVTDSGTAIYYKSRKNGIYIKYVQENKEINTLFDFIQEQSKDNPLFTAIKQGTSIIVHYNKLSEVYTYKRTAFTIKLSENSEYKLKVDLDWDDFFNEDDLAIDSFAEPIVEKVKELDPYYSNIDVQEIMTYAYYSSVPKSK